MDSYGNTLNKTHTDTVILVIQFTREKNYWYLMFYWWLFGCNIYYLFFNLLLIILLQRNLLFIVDLSGRTVSVVLHSDILLSNCFNKQLPFSWFWSLLNWCTLANCCNNWLTKVLAGQDHTKVFCWVSVFALLRVISPINSKEMDTSYYISINK